MRSEILGIEPNRVGYIALLLKVVRLPNPSFVISFGFLQSALFFPALRDRWRESEIAKDEGDERMPYRVGDCHGAILWLRDSRSRGETLII